MGKQDELEVGGGGKEIKHFKHIQDIASVFSIARQSHLDQHWVFNLSTRVVIIIVPFSMHLCVIY